MLAKKARTSLEDYFYVRTFPVNKDMPIEELDEYISDLFKSQKLNLVVYISGETRNIPNMMKLNFEFPASISYLCEKAKIPLIYLSSLSIYGIPKKNYFSTDSQKSPFTIYGRTKLKFDNLLKNNFSNLKFCAIAPGTIINPYSNKNNLIKKIIGVLSSKPLIWVLKYISPAGNLACVHIDDLIICIVKESLEITFSKDEQLYKRFKNCSAKVRIYDLVTYIIGYKPTFIMKYIPIKSIKLISLFFPKNFRMKLLVYLIDIEYLNNYMFLEKRALSNYF